MGVGVVPNPGAGIIQDEGMPMPGVSDTDDGT